MFSGGSRAEQWLLPCLGAWGPFPAAAEEQPTPSSPHMCLAGASDELSAVS